MTRHVRQALSGDVELTRGHGCAVSDERLRRGERERVLRAQRGPACIEAACAGKQAGVLRAKAGARQVELSTGDQRIAAGGQLSMKGNAVGCIESQKARAAQRAIHIEARGDG